MHATLFNKLISFTDNYFFMRLIQSLKIIEQKVFCSSCITEV